MNADQEDVTKSVYVIGGLGLGACLVLSMMMQHLLEVKQERDRPAVVLEVEQILGNRLVGHATLVPKDEAGRTAELHLKVLAGLDKEKIARSAGNLVWLRDHAKGVLEELTVVVRDEDGGTERFPIEQPFRSRPRSWTPVQKTPEPDPAKTGGQTEDRTDPKTPPPPPGPKK